MWLYTMKRLPIIFGAAFCFAVNAVGQVEVPRVAIYPWTFAENERGTNSTAVSTALDVLRKLFEQRGGLEVISEGACRRAWLELGYPEVPLTVEDVGQLPTSFDTRKLLEFGRKVNADYVCSGTLAWRVRSVWVSLGTEDQGGSCCEPHYHRCQKW